MLGVSTPAGQAADGGEAVTDLPLPPTRPVDRLYLRDAARLRILAQEVLRQIEFFEGHSRQNTEDRMRLVLIQTDVLKMVPVAKRAAKRYWREWEERSRP